MPSDPPTESPPGPNHGFAGGVTLGIRTARGRRGRRLAAERRRRGPAGHAGEARRRHRGGRRHRHRQPRHPQFRRRRRPRLLRRAERSPHDRIPLRARPCDLCRLAQAAPDRVWVDGTAMLIRRAVIESIGYFDEDLFAYREDADICLRAIRAGFRNVPASAMSWSPMPPSCTRTARAARASAGSASPQPQRSAGSAAGPPVRTAAADRTSPPVPRHRFRQDARINPTRSRSRFPLRIPFFDMRVNLGFIMLHVKQRSISNK